MVPPISEPPISWFMPIARMIIGSKTIINTVKMIEIDTTTVRSALALEAAAVAMAALVPQTLVAVERVMTRGLLSIFNTFVPSHHMNRITMGVTIQVMPKP